MIDLLRRDRLLFGLSILLSGFVLAPLFVTPYVPLHDLPDHVGLACLMRRVLAGHEVSAAFYRVQALPVPYWTSYLVVALAEPIVGVGLAAKLLVAISLLAAPFGSMRLLSALGRSPRPALFIFGLSWNHLMSWGFVANNLGMGLLLFGLAKVVEAKSPREALRLWPWALVISLTHAEAGALFVLGSWVLLPTETITRSRVIARVIASVQPIVVLAPWVVHEMFFTDKTGPRPTGPMFELPSLAERFDRFKGFTLDGVPDQFGNRWIHVAYYVLLFAPLVLLVLPQRRGLPWIAPIIFVVTCGGLYYGLPMTIFHPIDQWYIYPRYAVVSVRSLYLVPAAQLLGKSNVVLAAAVFATVATTVPITRQHASFGERARAFRAIIDAVRPESRLLTLTLDENDPAGGIGPYNQFHAYVVAEKGGYDPYLFDNSGHPIVHRAEARLPRPDWNHMGAFSSGSHAIRFDYVLTQGLANDPIREGPIDEQHSFKKVVESGRWRLYEIVRAKQ